MTVVEVTKQLKAERSALHKRAKSFVDSNSNPESVPLVFTPLNESVVSHRAAIILAGRRLDRRLCDVIMLPVQAFQFHLVLNYSAWRARNIDHLFSSGRESAVLWNIAIECIKRGGSAWFIAHLQDVKHKFWYHQSNSGSVIFSNFFHIYPHINFTFVKLPSKRIHVPVASWRPSTHCLSI